MRRTIAYLFAAFLAVAQTACGDGTNSEFRLRGRIVYARNDVYAERRVFVVEDPNGPAVIFCDAGDASVKAIKPGDVASFEGMLRVNAYGKSLAYGTVCRLLATGSPVTPVDADVSELLDGKFDFKLARTTGMLRDATFSETYSGWIILVVCGRMERIFISVQGDEATLEHFRRLIGSKVYATGVCIPSDPSARMTVGRTFKVASADDIAEVKPPPECSARVPDIGEISSTRESEMPSLGYHRARGRVVAAWHKRKALIQMADGSFVGIEFANPPLPRFGETIEAVGLPESDLFRLNLVNASWKSLAPPVPDARKPVPVTPETIVSIQNGHSLVNCSLHGSPVSIEGVIRSISTDGSVQIHVECDRSVLLVDADAMGTPPSGLAVGAKVRVCGTCVFEPDSQRRLSAFPQLKNFILVMRSPDGIVVLESPPWWTPRRLAVVIGGLLAVIFGIIVRNKLQKRKAAMLAKFSTELKVEERTRLAVELHDSLAQNLTGVSLEIDTAGKLAETDPKAMREHLGQATRTLKSCRDELRNCIWDLRNRALEESSMDEAIRQTLAPHVIGVDVAIRFNVPREMISDNTAHAILRSIRELAINAVRHGKASKIWIAGSIDGDNLLFSVRDNGTGFDPATAPGFAEGHYGLVGITERIEALEGEFNIESSPGSGAKATARISARRETPDTR